MDQTRRSFIQNTAILSAGAAAGLAGGMWASRMIRTHGPVDVWGYFLSKQPIRLVRCTLASDEHQDLFSICIIDRDGKGTGIGEAPLGSIRKAVKYMEGAQKMTCLCMTKEKKESAPLTVATEHGKVLFTFGDCNPIWMSLEDVQRVL